MLYEYPDYFGLDFFTKEMKNYKYCLDLFYCLQKSLSL